MSHLFADLFSTSFGTALAGACFVLLSVLTVLGTKLTQGGDESVNLHVHKGGGSGGSFLAKRPCRSFLRGFF